MNPRMEVIEFSAWCGLVNARKPRQRIHGWVNQPAWWTPEWAHDQRMTGLYTYQIVSPEWAWAPRTLCHQDREVDGTIRLDVQAVTCKSCLWHIEDLEEIARAIGAEQARCRAYTDLRERYEALEQQATDLASRYAEMFEVRGL